MDTFEMLSELKVGQYAECINAPKKPRTFSIAYCVEVDEDTEGIRWCDGARGYLIMAPFIVSKAKWRITNKGENE